VTVGGEVSDMAGDANRPVRPGPHASPSVIVVTPSAHTVGGWVTSPERPWRVEGKPC
jgi:hypothetical protein